MMNNKGITIITLIVMIAVIIILTSIFMATGLDSLKEAKNSEIKNEIYQLKQAVVNRYTSYEKNDGNIALIGTLAKNEWSNFEDCLERVIASLTYDNETIEERTSGEARIKKEISRDYNKFVMIVNSGDRLRLGLENSSDNVYIVNYYTGAVYGPIKD